MQYKANPVVVDAFIIVLVGPISPAGSMDLALQTGEKVHASKQMIARYIPQEGDYWVIQEDGYVYVNPKDVFERKYSPLPAPVETSANASKPTFERPTCRGSYLF